MVSSEYEESIVKESEIATFEETKGKEGIYLPAEKQASMNRHLAKFSEIHFAPNSDEIDPSSMRLNTLKL